MPLYRRSPRALRRELYAPGMTLPAGYRLRAPAPDAENSTGATALYERAGMRVINRWDLWERVLGNPRGD